MKPLFTLIFLCLSLSLSAQSITDFEDIILDPDTFLNGSDGSGGFTSGNAFLPNSYNTMFNSWSGWAISRDTDTLSPGFMNQYSAITGQGMDSSSNYAVSFGTTNVMHLRNEAAGIPVPGFYITNNTYAFLSMRDGDSFAKKFGGVSGDDPDFFLLTIKSYFNGMLSTDSVDFYLADYRFTDNSEDYIIDEWTYLDLSSLGNADSLWFSLNSSDTSRFGFNTPSYFCVDNIGEELTTGLFSQRPPELSFSLYPNPAQGIIAIQNLEERDATYSIYTLNGKMIQQNRPVNQNRSIDIQNLPSGSYLFRVESQTGIGSQIFIKQ